MMKSLNSRRSAKGIWASLDLMLSFLIIVCALMPVMECASLKALQASQSAHYSRLLSYAIQDSGELYFHGASQKSRLASGSYSKIGYFDNSSFIEYSKFAAERASSHGVAASYYLSEPNSFGAGAEAAGGSGRVCVFRIMAYDGNPVFPFVCMGAVR